MRTSYLGITACCAIVYLYVCPVYLIMPLMVASGIGSAAVIYTHTIFIRQLHSAGLAQSASSIPWRLIKGWEQVDLIWILCHVDYHANKSTPQIDGPS